jgi:hypothetical protein
VFPDQRKRRKLNDVSGFAFSFSDYLIWDSEVVLVISCPHKKFVKLSVSSVSVSVALNPELLTESSAEFFQVDDKHKF